MNQSYRLALLCGALPLIVGVAIFCLWLVTRWEWLGAAGACTLLGGVAMFLIGVIALVRYCWLALPNPDVPRRRLWFSTLGAAFLHLTNFLVAGGIIYAVIAIETRYSVTINNASRHSIDEVRVTGVDAEISFDAHPTWLGRSSLAHV